MDLAASKAIKTLTRYAIADVGLKYPPSSWGQVELIARTSWLLQVTTMHWWSLELQLSAPRATVPPAGEPGSDSAPALRSGLQVLHPTPFPGV